MKKITKAGLIGLTVIGAYMIGEYANPADKAKEKFRDMYVSREEGFYKGKLDIVKPINENKREEIYLVEKETGKLHPIGQIDSLPVVNVQVVGLDYKLKSGWGEFKEDVKETCEGIEQKVDDWSKDTKEWWAEKTEKDTASVDALEEPGWLKRQYEGVKNKFSKKQEEEKKW